MATRTTGFALYWALGGWNSEDGEVIGGGVKLYPGSASPRGSDGYATRRDCKRVMLVMLEAAQLRRLWNRHGPGILVILDDEGNRVDLFEEQAEAWGGWRAAIAEHGLAATLPDFIVD